MEFAALGVRNPARALPFEKRNDAGERARAIGPGARTAYDLGRLNVFGRQRTPDHPAAKRVILRHAVQRHERAARPRSGDGAQGNALDGRVCRKGGIAPEQRQARDLAKRLIELVRNPQLRGIDERGRVGLIADRVGWPGGDRNRFGCLGAFPGHGGLRGAKPQSDTSGRGQGPIQAECAGRDAIRRPAVFRACDMIILPPEAISPSHCGRDVRGRAAEPSPESLVGIRSRRFPPLPQAERSDRYTVYGFSSPVRTSGPVFRNPPRRYRGCPWNP